MSNDPTSTGQQVAEQDNSPSALVVRYRGSFTGLLPSHMRESDGGDVWIAGVEALLRTRPEIAAAAKNDPGAFLSSLVPAAQRGLTPGTEEYYLVPFAPKAGQPRILQGIIGYQGLVELIYRAGAVSSVIVEVVKSKDTFAYQPGRDERPQHEVDWFGSRGDLIGAYAYAIMRDGATSKVVVIGPDEISKAKAKSASAGSKYSPWQTNPESMWLKTAARQLAKWVPTSAEYRRQQLRDAQAVIEEGRRNSGLAEQLADLPIPLPVVDGEYVDEVTGEIATEEPAPARGGEAPTEAETVGGAGANPPSRTAPPTQKRPATAPSEVPPSAATGDGEVPAKASAGTSPTHLVAVEPADDADPDPDLDAISPTSPSSAPILSRQKRELIGECARLGIQSDPRLKLTYFDLILGRPEGKNLTSVETLTRVEAEQILHLLTSMPDRAALEAWGAGQNQLLADTTE